MTGPIEAKLVADLNALVCTHAMGETLAASALGLARALDAGVGSRDHASIHRELRETLNDLAKMGAPGEDTFGDALSAPVLDAPQPGEADSRPGDR